MIKIALHALIGKEQLQGQKMYYDDYEFFYIAL
jgi:hypothetical protein